MIARPNQLARRGALHRYYPMVGLTLIGVLLGGCSELRLQHHLQATFAEVYWATYCFPKNDKDTSKDLSVLSKGMNGGKVTYSLTTMVGANGQVTTPYGFSLSPTFQRTHEIQVEIDLNKLNSIDLSPVQCQELEELPKRIWKNRMDP